MAILINTDWVTVKYKGMGGKPVLMKEAKFIRAKDKTIVFKNFETILVGYKTDIIAVIVGTWDNVKKDDGRKTISLVDFLQAVEDKKLKTSQNGK